MTDLVPLRRGQARGRRKSDVQTGPDNTPVTACRDAHRYAVPAGRGRRRQPVRRSSIVGSIVGTRPSAPGGVSALSRRRRTAIALLAACAPVLAACGANFDAQTNQVYQPAVGVNDRSGDVYVVNALVVTDGSGTGTVVASLINQANQSDRLVNVLASTTAGAPLEATGLRKGIELPPLEAVQIVDDRVVSVTSTAAGAEPGSDKGGVTAGGYVTLQLQFERAPVVEVTVPVVSKSSEHQDVYRDIPVNP